MDGVFWRTQGCDRYKEFVSPNQIQIQMGLDLLVRPDTRDDPSQPWEDQSDQNHHGKGGCLEERNEKPEPNIGNGQCCVPTAPARAHKERHREQNWNPAKTGGNKFVIICMLFGATVARYYQASPVSCTYSQELILGGCGNHKKRSNDNIF